MSEIIAGIQDLRQLINSAESNEVLSVMLQTAEQMLVNTVDKDSDVSSDTRETIKLWLAAHFVHIKDRLEKEVSSDGVRMVFDGKTDVGLNATLYGQQAMAMDPTGFLAKTATSKGKLTFYIKQDFDPTTRPLF